VQVEPFTPTLKAPGSKHLKLQYDQTLSTFAFKFNLHRFDKAAKAEKAAAARAAAAEKATADKAAKAPAEAGAYTRSKFQLNLCSSVHSATQLNSWMCPEVAQVELNVNE